MIITKPTDNQLQQLWDMVAEFINDKHISCPEVTCEDRVSEDAPDLVANMCEIVGYYDYPEEKPEEPAPASQDWVVVELLVETIKEWFDLVPADQMLPKETTTTIITLEGILSEHATEEQWKEYMVWRLGSGNAARLLQARNFYAGIEDEAQ